MVLSFPTLRRSILLQAIFLIVFLAAGLHAQPPGLANKIHLAFPTDPASSTYTILAPFRYGDQLYFSSSYLPEPGADPVLRFYQTSGLHAEQAPVIFNPGQSKGRQQTANMTLTPDGQQMFFTICQDESVFHQEKCSIWTRSRQYDGTWAAAERLPDSINVKGYTSTQPSIGYDWVLKKYILFFTSNRPGGKGGTDLWCCILEPDGQYGEVFSPAFNTPFDEVTPYFHFATHQLFFSSNGLGGYGGLDIFSAVYEGANQWEKPVHTGERLNSTSDDLYFMTHSPSGQNYLASNRERPAGEPGQSRSYCLDLYEIDNYSELQVMAIDADAMSELGDLRADVLDLGSEKVSRFTSLPFDDKLIIPLKGGRAYRIIFRKSGYLTSVMEIDLDGLAYPLTLERSLLLFPDEPANPQPIPAHQPVNGSFGMIQALHPVETVTQNAPDPDQPAWELEEKATRAQQNLPF